MRWKSGNRTNPHENSFKLSMKLFRGPLYKIHWGDRRNRIACLIRVWINFFHCIGLDFFLLPIVTMDYLSFYRKGNEVLLFFPWSKYTKMKKGCKWYCVDWCSSFKTLKEIDELELDYAEHCYANESL